MIKLHNKLFMATAVFASPVALCSGLTSVIVLFQKTQGLYFPSEYPIVGSGAIQDWIWLTLTIAFVLGIFPACLLFIFRSSWPYVIARIIQLPLFLAVEGLGIFMRHTPLGDLLFASVPLIMMGFFISLSIHGGMDPEPLLKR